MIRTAHCQSPIGFLELRATESALLSVRRQPEVTPFEAPDTPLLTLAAEQLTAYFAGRLTRFDLPLAYGDASAFRGRVWDLLQQIPYGQTRSYLHLARQLGDPKAVRAVGMANRTNPFAIVVPCHRVIAQNGDLQGYFYGLAVKRQLLALENPRGFGVQGVISGW